MKSKAFSFWIAVLFLVMGASLIAIAIKRADRGESGSDAPLAVAQQSTGHEDLTVDASAQPIEFDLINQDGEPFSSRQLEGKIWVGSVFFTTCPSTCRAQNQQVARLQKEFADQGVEFVSITCDPQRDTPKVLTEYGSMFNAQPGVWHFLTGEFEDIQRIGNDGFGIVVAPQTHSDRLVLFDREGRKRGSYRSTNANDFQQMQIDLRELLTETVSNTDVEQ